MGKIRVKTFGDEATEEAEKKKAEVKRAEKKARSTGSAGSLQTSSEQAREASDDTAGVKPEEEVNQSVAPELKTQTESHDEVSNETPVESAENKPSATKTKKTKFAKKARGRSSKYKAAVGEIDKNKSYSLKEALELLKKIKIGKFDETVELHINTTEAGISGTVKLPHGTGKEIRVAIADDSVLAEVEKGKINFDILISTPANMPKLGKVAKVLGPRGLMPNPKNGTISDNPQEAMKKFQGGLISFKTESKMPLMHLTVGKISFGDDKLSENIKTIITAVKEDRIQKVTLKSTMSPGIKLAI